MIFSDIDLLQELKRFDVEFSKEKPKNWFSALSAKLNYQNKVARKREQQRQLLTSQSTITIAKNGLVFF
ncbi:MAG: hypothetical protein ACL7BU_16320 [Candidatus Phlomobacter fragariae]